MKNLFRDKQWRRFKKLLRELELQFDFQIGNAVKGDEAQSSSSASKFDMMIDLI